MEVRPATDADTEALVKLWTTTGLGSEPDEDAAEITERLRRDPELFVVAVEDGRIVASVMGCYDGHRGFLKRVAVTPEHQGTGVGRLIVEEVERRLPHRTCAGTRRPSTAPMSATRARYVGVRRKYGTRRPERRSYFGTPCHNESAWFRTES